MAGFGGCHGDLNRFVVAHLAKQNDIGALAQSGAQSGNIAFRIYVDLTLAYDTFIMAVQKFHRIFQRNDMFAVISVDIVDDAGKGCGFSASRSPGDQNHSFRKFGEIDDLIRNAEIGRVWQCERDDSYYDGQCISLFVSADTETGKPRHGKGKIIVAFVV